MAFLNICEASRVARAPTVRILAVRNDKLGDFMLAWPAFALIKKYLPQAHVTVLVPEYTAPMARLCPAIDEVLIDDRSHGILSLARQLRSGHYDVLLTLFSSNRIALAGLLSGISYRLAPATKLAQLFYNHRLIQRRSRSEKPEYAYNLDLVMRMLSDLNVTTRSNSTQEREGDWLPVEVERPLLRFGDDRMALKQTFCNQNGLDIAHKLVFIHPGSGGSANNLHPEQYAQLANLLEPENTLAFVISAGPGERSIAERVARDITAPVVVYESSGGLPEFARTLQLADLFISGSTGTLHIAGAMNIKTAAFYPRRRSATPLRWQTLNTPHYRLAITPPESVAESNVSMIDITNAADRISRQFLSG